MTINRARFSSKLSTRFIVLLVACAIVASILGATAYMQTRKQQLPDAPVARPVEDVSPKTSKRVASDNVEALADTVVKPNDIAHSPTVAGTCDTAGPIEVESTGGTAAGVPTPYATLALAFTAINGGTLHTGTITIDVCGNTTETGTAALNQVAGVTSVTISPAGGAARTISGAIAAGNSLINLNGADNVTINGLNTGGNSLTLSNTTVSATSGTATVRLVADATNNTVTNTSILGSSTSSGATLTGNIVISSGTTTGNDNNTFSNNNIGPAGANLPSKAVISTGSSSTIENDNVQITGNNIFDFFLPTASVSGVTIQSGNEAWIVSNNKFYQTAPRTFTVATLRYSAITLTNSSGGFTVSGNTIGFGAANGTGTTTISGLDNEFRGIDAASVRTTAPATLIQNNIISGINQTTSRNSTTTASSPFIAVAMGTTDGLINATGNTIGSLDGSSTIVINETSTTTGSAPVLGFYNFSFFATTISNNNIGAITIQSTGTTTGFRGIFVNTTTGVSATVNNNTIGGTNAAGAITDTQVGSYAMYGIVTSLPNLTATGNIIRNMSGASTAAATIVSGGILASGSTGANTISQNTIHSLSNASGAGTGSIYGMSLSLPATTNLIERNFIHSFSMTATVTGTQIWGISGGATGTATYQNNMIRLGIDAAGNSVTLPSSVIGIRDSAGATNQFYHNTVYIGGTGVLATPTAANSYCFFSDVVTVTRNYQDNIFWNARSNAVSGGVAHIAIRVGGTAANPAGLTSNYNVLHFSGTDGATGVFNATVVPTLAAWRTATGQDANSIAADPQLIAPNGTAATVDLHIHPTNPTPIESAGLAIGTVTNDFDGQTRASLTPTDIGADAGNFTALDISPPIISYTPLANTASTSNRTLTATITDASGVPTTGIGLPVLYYRKGSSGAFTAAQATFAGGSTYNFTIDYTAVGGVTAGDTIQYYVVAQDGASPPNVGSNPAAGAGSFTANPPAAGTPPTTPNSYSILASISGTFNVGAGGTYTTLTAAIADLNNKVLNGPVTFVLTDASYTVASGETFPLTINANGGSSATNTVTIKPATGVTPSISGSSASAIIFLNGVDFVTIEGSNSASLLAPQAASRDLTITNTNAGTSSAVIWLESNGADGATNNKISDVNAVGSGNTQTLVGIGSGSSTISITSTGTGNNNNRFQNCNISKTQYGIYSGGASAANKNTGNVITQNVINAATPNNVATGGILVNFENGVQLTQNVIENILKHDGTTGTTGTAFGIALGVVPSNTVTTFTGSDCINAVVTGNKINGVVQLNSTGYSAFGIVVNSVTSGTTLVANNFVSGVRAASTASDFSAGIVAGGGAGSTTQVYFNSVSMTGSRNAATFPSYGLALGGTNPTADVRDNILFNTQTSTSTGKSYAIGLAYASPYTNLTSDYNDLFTSGTSAFFAQTGGLGTAGTDRTSLAAWRTETGKDANSISADPLFASTSDLHVSSSPVSPVNGAGITITGITTDFDGETRSATPDIGADEINFPGTLGFDNNTYQVNEGDGTLTINITRTGGTDGTVTVNYATANGSATAGSDYTAQSGTLTWLAGDGTNKQIVIPITDDNLYEGTESLSTTLSAPTGGATISGPNPVGALINDNDAPPTFTIDNVTHNEGNTGTTSFVFTVTKTAGNTNLNTFINYTTMDGTATVANNDYQAASGQLMFAPADTSQTITVLVNGDTQIEADEAFTVNISGAGTTIPNPNGTGTIQNDDAAGSIQLSSATYSGSEGDGQIAVTVTRTGGSSGAVAVTLNTSNGSATAGSDYTAVTGQSVMFADGDAADKTINIPVTNDTDYEGPESFNVTLSAPTGGATLGSPATAVVTINDNDTPPATLVVNTNDDIDNGFCLTSHCSLREAINAANANADVSTITFQIPGTGVHTIMPGAALPLITQPVLINGYSQTGAQENTLVTGNDAVLRIELDGTNAGSAVSGLEIAGTGSTVQGLVINRFNVSGLLVGGSGHTVRGNYLGVNAAGTAAQGNNIYGVGVLNSNNNTIGGTAPGDRNVISGNGSNGVQIDGVTGHDNVVRGNLIGTDATGTVDLGNTQAGVALLAGAHDNTIGGTAAGARNVISGNNGFGVRIGDDNTANNTVQGNYIGTDSNGTAALGNGAEGVIIGGNVGTTGNTVGGASAGAGNVIANNGQAGIVVTGAGASNNAIRGNSIHDNQGLGIDLGANGVTANDAGDPDTGANNLQNFPVITAATVTGSTRNISGTLNSTSGGVFTIDFYSNATCDASGNGEGQTYLGSATTDPTDGSGNVSFTFHPSVLSAGQVITATATDANGNTSEFSACFTAVGGTAGQIEFTSATYSVAENVASGMAAISVTRTGGSNGSITATFSTGDGTASAGSDYTAVTNASITYADGETGTKTVNVPISDDSVYEGDETVNLSLSTTMINGPQLPPVGGTSATLTITENDAAPTFAIDDVTHNEGDSSTTAFVFIVTKTGATALPASVAFTTVDGTATVANNDYATNSGTLNFAAADTMMQITVLVNGDTTFEPNEAFTVHLSNATNATIADADGTGTITNDDASASGSLQFSAANYTVNESNATATITVTRTGGTDNAVSVEYATSDGTAMQPGDYASASGTLNWANGDGAPKTFTVTIVNDTTAEPDETVNLSLSNPQGGAALGAQSTATLTIQDNDAAATVKVIRPGGLQGWTQQHTTCGSGTTGSQAFVVGPGTPPAGEGSLDYMIGADGDSFETIRNPDYNNTTLSSLSNLSYSTYVTTTGSGGQAAYLLLNIDNDNDGTLDDQLFFEPVYQNGTYSKLFADDTIPNQCGTNLACVTTGTWQTWNALVGGWWSANESAGGPPLITLQRYAVEHPNARIVNTDTGAGGFRIATGCGAGAWDNFDGNADNVRIGVGNTNTLYDLEPLPRLSIDDVPHMEGNSGTTAYTFTVTLSEPSGQTVTVDYATADDTATAPSDYTAIPATTLTFDPGQTSKQVTVQVNGDFLLEPDETFFVNLSNVNASATILDGQGVGTIQNDDVPQVGISISDAFVAEPATGTSTATFTVSLAGPSTQTVTVDYATADGTAVAPGDYTAIPPTQLVFMPGQTTKTINVTVNGDGLTEGNENFFVNLSNPSGNAVLSDGQGEGTITDPTATGQLLISEFRFRGPTFSAPQNINGFRDEYVELYNNTNNPITVATTDGSEGWTLAALNAAGTGADVLAQIPNGTVIPARGHFLAINSDETTTTRPNIVPEGGYSLNGYAVGDAFYVTDVSDNAGVAIFNTANVANFTTANRLDAVGFTGTVGATADTFREGVGLQSPGAVDGQYAFVRRLETGIPQDTDDNAADFVFIATDGGTYGGVQSILGAPGPENCGCLPTNQFPDHSPIQRNAQIKASLIEPQALATAPPNRVRDASAVGPNASQGTLELRRRFKNTTGQPVTRLRFRVVDVTTLNTPNPGGVQADIRWLSSTDTPVTTSLGNLTLRGTVIETPPTQGMGGGLNSSGVVTLPGGALANGATIDVRFVLGVQAPGRFRFFVNVEALP